MPDNDSEDPSGRRKPERYRNDTQGPDTFTPRYNHTTPQPHEETPASPRNARYDVMPKDELRRLLKYRNGKFQNLFLLSGLAASTVNKLIIAGFNRIANVLTIIHFQFHSTRMIEHRCSETRF